jgi:hypothetical protein
VVLTKNLSLALGCSMDSLVGNPGQEYLKYHDIDLVLLVMRLI